MEGVDAAPRHALGVACVLSEDPPTGDEAAAEKWARHDVICRGHILATLSDRLLPDYAHHATARALWEAVARTYDVETPSVWLDKFWEFRFDEGGHFLEQLVHTEALDATAELSDAAMALELRWKLPELVRTDVVLWPGADKRDMSLVWESLGVMCLVLDWSVFGGHQRKRQRTKWRISRRGRKWRAGPAASLGTSPGTAALQDTTMPGNAGAGLDQGKAMGVVSTHLAGTEGWHSSC
jgi:hypothetical protein